MMLNGLTKAVAQVEDAKKHGGQILLGGNRVTGSEDYLFKAHNYQAWAGDAYQKRRVICSNLRSIFIQHQDWSCGSREQYKCKTFLLLFWLFILGRTQKLL